MILRLQKVITIIPVGGVVLSAKLPSQYCSGVNRWVNRYVSITTFEVHLGKIRIRLDKRDRFVKCHVRESLHSCVRVDVAMFWAAAV